MGLMGFVLKEMVGTKVVHFWYVGSPKVNMFLGIIFLQENRVKLYYSCEEFRVGASLAV